MLSEASRAIQSAIKNNQAASLALAKEIQRLRLTKGTGPQREALNREKKVLGRSTRALLLAYGVQRGKGRWRQEPKSRAAISVADVLDALQYPGRSEGQPQAVAPRPEWTEGGVATALARTPEKVAADLFPRLAALPREERTAELKKQDRQVRDAYHALVKARHFVPENRRGDPEVEVSPSGKYTLTIQGYSAEYSHTEGTVTADGKVIAVVQRNYSSFPFLFIEGHPDGHDYLVCGENYQGQTVIQLDTGARRDYLPPDARVGAGFCWVDMTFHAPTATLVVAGCIWAAPYEYRLYDFSRPMSGWRELAPEKTYFDCDRRWPTFEADGTIRFYATGPETEDLPEGDLPPIAAIRTFRRERGKLVLVSEEVTPEEQARRAADAEARATYERATQAFYETDPLYLAYQKRLLEPGWRPESYAGWGVTHDKWGPPEWKGEERRYCRRIYTRQGDRPGLVIDLEWAIQTGPVKLEVYPVTGEPVVHFFPHTVDGLNNAMDVAQRYIEEQAPTVPVARLYLVTRADLIPGQQAVQAAHALREFVEHHPEHDREWYQGSNTLAFLAAKDEAHLHTLLEKATRAGFAAAPFREPDRNNELTAVAFAPEARKLCSRLPLALKAS